MTQTIMNTKTLTTSILFGCVSLCAFANNDPLRFNPDKFTRQTITMPTGETVKYRAYEDIFYVSNVEDSTYQTLNIYVPEKLAELPRVPVFLRTYVGGYAASTAKSPSPADATGRALQEGYVVCIPGSRGNNSTVERNGKTVYTGVAPNGLLDLKAAVRYLRHNDALIPGDSELIFTDGTSAGGAMSSAVPMTVGVVCLIYWLIASAEIQDVFNYIFLMCRIKPDIHLQCGQHIIIYGTDCNLVSVMNQILIIMVCQQKETVTSRFFCGHKQSGYFTFLRFRRGNVV